MTTPARSPKPPKPPKARKAAAAQTGIRTGNQTGAQTGMSTGVQTETETVADRVHAAVLALPGVSDLHPGSFGEVATYAAGRRVVGVRVRPDRAEVHVVAAWNAPVLETADEVRRTVEPLTGTPVDVYVDDVAAPPEAAVPPSAAPAPPAAPASPAGPTSSRRTS